MLDPKQRVIMVSGANRGIGLAVARNLAAKGFGLSLGARDLSALEAVAPQADGGISLQAYEASDPAAGRAWVEAALERHGRIDGLVNNAGIYRPTGFLDEDESGLDEMWAVNVKAPLRLIRAAWPHLKAAGSGRVVNVASMSGKRVMGEAIGYTMSKFSLVALTHQVRRSGWEDGIRATAICPSFVNTDMAAGITDQRGGAMTQPEDLAELVATALALPNTASVAELTVNWNYEVGF